MLFFVIFCHACFDGVGGHHDGDGDGYASPEDCDDLNAGIHPGAAEVCDGLDNDCDGDIDNGVQSPFYADADGDGFGDQNPSVYACTAPADHLSTGEDCDDQNPEIHPEAAEICNGLDDDCDGQIELRLRTYQDSDGDGVGRSDLPISSCTPQAHSASLPGDCDDSDPTIHPFAPENCDGLDNDCDGQSDEGAPGPYFIDADADGFGQDGESGLCTPPENAVLARGDCDDDDATIHPGAPDPVDDGVDQDCGGSDGPESAVALGGENEDDLQGALDAAQDGQTIWVGPGQYTVADLDFKGKNLRLRSTHGPQSTQLIGTDRLVYFHQGEEESAMIEGFELTGAGQSAMVITHASPTLKDLIFRNNDGDSGAALALQNATAMALTCQFIDNQAALTGGAIAIFDSALYLQDSWLQNNDTLAGPGGAIHGERAALTAINTQFLANRSPNWGGAISLNDSGFTGDGLILHANQAALGGGLFLERVQSFFTHSSLSANQSGGQGGGLYSTAGELNLSALQFLGNLSQSDGGGLYFTGGNGYLEDLDFYGNGAALRGGALALSQAYLSAGQLIFEQNYTFDGQNGWGGALHIHDAGVDLSYFRASQNQVMGDAALGGALFVDAASPFLHYFILEQNRSAHWGGAFAASEASATLNHGVFYGNQAQSGGALALLGASSPGIHGTILQGNSPNNLHLCCENEWGDFPAPYFTNSSLVLDAGQVDHNPPYIDPSNHYLAAEFMAADAGDYHLALNSPLIDGGWDELKDVDGSIEDIGIFGEAGGAGWDLDRDGLPAYFWPGSPSDTPLGIDGRQYDCNDRDASIQNCQD